MRMTPVKVKTVNTQSHTVHFSFRKTQASSEVKTGLLFQNNPKCVPIFTQI